MKLDNENNGINAIVTQKRAPGMTIVAPQTRELSGDETARLLGELKKSVVRAENRATGQTQFAGEMRHPELGRARVRGIAQVYNGNTRIDGLLGFGGHNLGLDDAKAVEFMVEQTDVNRGGVDEVMKLYEKQIAGKNPGEIRRINGEFKEIFELLSTRMRESGQPTMYVADLARRNEVVGQVTGLEAPSALRRLVVKTATAIGMASGKIKFDENHD